MLVRMALTLQEVANAVDSIAPFRLAEKWDNVGLQVGDPRARVNRLLVALEVSDRAIRAARQRRCEAILSHHPLIFHPLKSVMPDSPVGRRVMELVRSGIGLIAAHTNIDRVMHGTNGAIAAKLGMTDLEFFDREDFHDSFKFAVFVPPDFTTRVIEAIHRGGGGWIGKYSHCTFRSSGTGTYTPDKGAQPYRGERGRFEQSQEERLEALVSRAALPAVLREVLAAHPYEEVAYDIYPLHNVSSQAGLGLVGVLPAKTTLGRLARTLRAVCDATLVSIVGRASTSVRRLAVLTGSPGSSIECFDRRRADALVTGELSYHRAQDALDLGIPVVMIGHAASEKIFASYLAQQLLELDRVRESRLKVFPFEGFPEPQQFV